MCIPTLKPNLSAKILNALTLPISLTAPSELSWTKCKVKAIFHFLPLQKSSVGSASICRLKIYSQRSTPRRLLDVKGAASS